MLRPGLYRSYVVEVEIEMLGVDALLFKKELEKLENYVLPERPSDDEYAQSHATLRVVSQLASSLYQQSLGG